MTKQIFLENWRFFFSSPRAARELQTFLIKFMAETWFMQEEKTSRSSAHCLAFSKCKLKFLLNEKRRVFLLVGDKMGKFPCNLKRKMNKKKRIFLFHASFHCVWENFLIFARIKQIPNEKKQRTNLKGNHSHAFDDFSQWNFLFYYENRVNLWFQNVL